MDASRRALAAGVVVVAVAAAVGLAATGSFGQSAGGPTPTAADGSTPGTDATPTDGGTATPRPGADLAEMSRRMSIPESPDVVEVDGLERTEVVVLATQGYYPDEHVADLVAFTADGEVIYHEADYGVYFDVDPVPGTRFTVEYLASRHFNDTTCDAVDADRCTRDVIRRVNLTTGESQTVYAEVTPRIYSARHHDADRIDDAHLVLADILRDRVAVVDTRSGEVVWEWRAEYDYAESSGGKWFDWTHLNDVEVLPDGRIMASLRNQDSVVFLDPDEPGQEALNESWTLGADDDHSVLHEQHNADYIPAERGGPAVLVGDSENDRVVEYSRVDGGWEQTWTWTREGLSWPRDADRLPNGNTVVVNSRGEQVLGVGPNGEVVWRVAVGMPYDVERLGTGDESAGGSAAGRRDGDD